MPEELAPPVVAVVVTSNPGEWFERCLESLSGQDYPNLAVLVIDDGSAVDVTSRVAAVEPAAVVRRLGAPGGYAAGANEALRGVEGASFFLFCHDDVVLDRDATRQLVEESFRANAGVVSPKVVSADDRRVLLQVGLGMHRLGTPAPRVHAGELDQAQHDEAREIFVAPGGCTLVRSDLFEALEGYDASMALFGEDVDFSWRAQIAGARVALAPFARVAHRQVAASGGREGVDTALLRRRHELRTALKNYGFWRRFVVVLELVVLGLAEMTVAMLSGERERARRVARSWRWNIAGHKSLRAARRHLREIRQVPDRVLVRRMTDRGRVRRFLRPETPAHGDVPHARHGELERLSSWWARVQHGDVPAAQLSLAAVFVVLGLAGVRDLLFSRLPVVGQLIPLPRGLTMLSQFFTGVPAAYGTHVAPSAYGVLGLLGLVLGDSTATALKLIFVASLAVGAIGVSRLCRPFLSSRGRLVATGAFLAMPLCWNSLGTGDVQAMVALGAMPYVFSRIARSTGLAPFAEPGGRAVGRSGLVGEIAPFGLLLAVMFALAPASSLALGVVLAAVVVSCLLQGRPTAAGRALGVTSVAVLVAAVCCLPWSATYLEHGASWSALSGAVPGQALSPASLLRGHTGPIGDWWGTFGLVVAAGYVLFVARAERLSWASCWWLAAIGSTALAWAGSEGWLGAGAGAFAVLVAPAAVGVAACCGLGAAAFERDVISAEALGWRQAGAGLAGLCLVVGAVPALATAVNGRAGLPAEGMGATLDWVAPTIHPYRVLYLADPRALPAAGWQFSRGLAWYTTTSGLPQGDQDWPPASPGDLARVTADLRAAEDGKTVDVGALLAPLGIRYVVLPTADAPEIEGTQSPPVVAAPPARLLSALGDQSDLVERPVEAGADVFDNADWSYTDGSGTAEDLRAGASPMSPRWRDAGLALGLATLIAAIAEGVRRRRSWDSRSDRTEPGDSPPGGGGQPGEGDVASATGPGERELAGATGPAGGAL